MANIPISSFTAAANATGIGMSGFSLTGSNAQSMLDLAGTWNTSGTPTGLKLNVTDTASNAASLLMDLQVGGVSRAYITKTGNLFLRGNTQNWLIDGNNIANQLGFYANGVAGGFSINANGATTISLNFAATISSTPDIILNRDAANTLAQRNGVNAQTFRVYNTYTDASNYQRIRISSDTIFTENAGTGAAQSLNLGGTSTGARLVLNPNGSINIYGASVANIWNFSVAGHFLAQTDNTYDIGASGANRPRTIYAGADIFCGGQMGPPAARLTSSGVGTTGYFGFAASNPLTPDTTLARIAAGIIGVRDGTTGGAALSLVEQTAPAAPATNGVYIYAEDNGSGKTRLMARFATGAAVQIAIEP